MNLLLYLALLLPVAADSKPDCGCPVSGVCGCASCMCEFKIQAKDNYHWRERTDGNDDERILVNSKGKDVGGYSFSQSVFMWLDERGEWIAKAAVCPISLPERPRVLQTRQWYIYPSFSRGCVSGSCSSR